MSNIDMIGYAKAGKVFTASNVSAKIITVVGTVMTGLVVYNPIGSNKYFSFLSAGFTPSADLASICSISLAISPSQPVIPSSTTAGSAVIKSATGAAGNSVGLTWDAATLGVACVSLRWIGGREWVTGGTHEQFYFGSDKIDGELGLMPGAALAFAGIGSTLPTGMASISYVEVDL